MATSFSTHAVQYENGNKTISYIAGGPLNGPLLIFIHGWPAIGKTWLPQLTTFASLGFRVIAPDMPGYGASTANNKIEDYAQEKINAGMLALLAHTERSEAVWIGHDWGAGSVSQLVAHHPKVCKAVVLMSVTYRSIDLGLQHLISTSDRVMYPKDAYPNGPWDYMVYYQQSFKEAIDTFDKNIEGTFAVLFQRPTATATEKPTPLASVTKNGGWFGGAPGAPSPDVLPKPFIDDELYSEVVTAFKKTGLGPGSSWYMNDAANVKYTLEKSVNGGVLNMPVLFVGGLYDGVCEYKKSRFAEEQRKLCKNLTEVDLPCGHWMGLEMPTETNAAISRFLVEHVKDYWPGFWTIGSTTVKL